MHHPSPLKKTAHAFLLMGIIVAIVLGATVIYLATRPKPVSRETFVPKAGSIPGEPSVTQTFDESGSEVTMVIIDYATCNRGSTSITFAFGSEHFVFEGKQGDNCLFYLGGEMENPRWDGSLAKQCEVPINLGAQYYNVGRYGADMKAIESYCHALST